MEIQSTRLRSIEGKLEDILGLVDSFPFKVEYKDMIQLKSGKFLFVFVIPDSVKEFPLVQKI